MTRRNKSRPSVQRQRQLRLRSNLPNHSPASTPSAPKEMAIEAVVEPVTSFEMVPYDEYLLERCRTQWQFGDWGNLSAISRDTLQHHPDRAKLALLAAAGQLALGNATEARQNTRLAMEWGCSKKLVSQILIAGVHNTLGRAAAIGGEAQRSLQHFAESIKIGMPHNDARLLVQARVGEQLQQLGLPVSSSYSSISNK